MFAIDSTEVTQGYKPVDFNAIEALRKDRFTQNFALAGFNGKNIALTGNYSEKSFKSSDGKVTKYVSLECIFADGNTDFANGKKGTIALSALKSLIRPVDTDAFENAVKDFQECSEKEALAILLKDGTYLQHEEDVTCLKPVFNIVDGKQVADYSNKDNTYKRYRYSVSTISTSAAPAQPA